MTQEQYSDRSAGSYSSFETVEVSERSVPFYRGSSVICSHRVKVFKIRRAFGGGMGKAYRVILLTDKPQKAIPWAAIAAAKAKQPTPDTMRPKLAEIQSAVSHSWLEDSTRQLLSDAAYVGWVSIHSMSQIGWTDEGMKELRASQPQAVAA
jgi:hypothetical protein